MSGLPERLVLALHPFVAARLRRRDAATSRAASGTDFGAGAGLDLKWHPTQDLVFDSAVNPDFAQVEADEAVLNLATYETYYPEKRPKSLMLCYASGWGGCLIRSQRPIVQRAIATGSRSCLS